jgi:hypothetical protein
MRIHLRLDSYNTEHAHMTLFTNGKNNGVLCMSPGEAKLFQHVLKQGADPLLDNLLFTGDFDKLHPASW